MITLYHGSIVRIKDIDKSRCNPYKDFGQAFLFYRFIFSSGMMTSLMVSMLCGMVNT